MESLAALLKEKKHTLAVVESSAGGLINAALVAVPGASAFYLGGAIEHLLAGDLADFGMAAQCPGNGHGREAELCRDVLDRGGSCRHCSSE